MFHTVRSGVKALRTTAKSLRRGVKALDKIAKALDKIAEDTAFQTELHEAGVGAQVASNKQAGVLLEAADRMFAHAASLGEDEDDESRPMEFDPSPAQWDPPGPGAMPGTYPPTRPFPRHPLPTRGPDPVGPPPPSHADLEDAAKAAVLAWCNEPGDTRTHVIGRLKPVQIQGFRFLGVGPAFQRYGKLDPSLWPDTTPEGHPVTLEEAARGFLAACAMLAEISLPFDPQPVGGA